MWFDGLYFPFFPEDERTHADDRLLLTGTAGPAVCTGQQGAPALCVTVTSTWFVSAEQQDNNVNNVKARTSAFGLKCVLLGRLSLGSAPVPALGFYWLFVIND